MLVLAITMLLGIVTAALYVRRFPNMILLATIATATFVRRLRSMVLHGIVATATFVRRLRETGPVPVSVNYHFTRKCNKSCGFCFHTAKTSYILPIADAKRGLALLKLAGMKKINFAGGEPFLYPGFLGDLVAYCKEVLNLDSVSIVSNGSKITEKWFQEYGKYVDILAVSCDSFDEHTNIKIGRGDGNNVQQLCQIASWCDTYGVKFKMNSVICRYNFDEDMSRNVADIGPFRWKCFQVLLQPGENDSDKTLRDARAFRITDEEFEHFCAKHKHIKGFVPEPNRLMASSYLILDEFMCFLDKAKNYQSQSILQIGVAEALQSVHWDEQGFEERGGLYDWSREEGTDSMSMGNGSCGGAGAEASKLDW